MTTNLLVSGLVVILMAALAGCGTGAVEDGSSVGATGSGLSGTEKVVYFGTLEVQNGALKVASGKSLHAGDNIDLQVFVPQVARFVEGDYCLADGAHLFMRTRGDQDFTVLSGMPTASYIQRGPYVQWSADKTDVRFTLPADADRIEVYMEFDRLTWNGGTCYMGYDIPECPDTSPLAPDWVSNYGDNFRVDVH